MFVTCNAVIGQAVKSWLTICLPAHQNITAYGLSLLIGLGRVAIFAIGLRKNQNDYVKLLIKHTTSDQLDPAQPAFLQALQEASPVDFMLAERHRNAQDLPFSLRIDTYRHQNRQVTHLSIFANLLVISI